jgi:hypothetical protein
VCRPDGLARRPRSLLVSLDHLRLADVRALWIEVSLPQRTALAEQVPALIEANLDLLEPASVRLAPPALRLVRPQRMFLGHKTFDLLMNLVIVHGRSVRLGMSPQGIECGTII